VTSVDELKMFASLGAMGVVLGSALYSGKIDIKPRAHRGEILMRKKAVKRKTRETDIVVKVNLDGPAPSTSPFPTSSSST